MGQGPRRRAQTASFSCDSVPEEAQEALDGAVTMASSVRITSVFAVFRDLHAEKISISCIQKGEQILDAQRPQNVQPWVCEVVAQKFRACSKIGCALGHTTTPCQE